MVRSGDLERLQSARVDDEIDERVALLLESHSDTDLSRLSRAAVRIQFVKSHDPMMSNQC